MNRLKKLASNKITCFDDVLKLNIEDFLTKICESTASNTKAIDFYMMSIDTPEERVEKLSNLTWFEIFEYICHEIDKIADKLFDRYSLKLDDDYEYCDFLRDLKNYIDDNLNDTITTAVDKNLNEFLMKQTKDGNSDFALKEMYAKEVGNNEDSIGETIKLIDHVDYDTRDAAFVDIDGDILISDKGATHAQLINKYIEDNNYFGELKDDWQRPSTEEALQKTWSDNIAFGHIVNSNVWIIDPSCTTMSIADVISDIKKSGNEYSKIYSMTDFDELERVAKKYR